MYNISKLTFTIMKIEDYFKEDKALSEQMSIEEAREFAKELEETIQNLDNLKEYLNKYNVQNKNIKFIFKSVSNNPNFTDTNINDNKNDNKNKNNKNNKNNIEAIQSEINNYKEI